jgi:hypothetical protein
MKQIVKYIKYLYHSSELYNNKLIKKWHNDNNQHIIKEEAILEFKEKYHYKILVETGTFLGEMVYALRNKFETLYTIELSRYLYMTAKKRFHENKNICFLHGDSGKVLEKVVNLLKEPAIFWLDGHYSGGITEKGAKETPVLNELKAIFSSPYSHIILIDDARCFGNPEFKDYPTFEELKDFVYKLNPSISSIYIKDDIIRIIT